MAKKKKHGALTVEWAKYMYIKTITSVKTLLRDRYLPYSLRNWELFFLHAMKSKTKKRNSSRRNTDVDVEHIAYRFHGEPTDEQATSLSQNTGCCRFLWNRMKADYDLHKKEMGYGIFNTPAEYKSLDECAFLKDADSYALCNVQLNFESAIRDAESGEKGYPNFKKKHVSKESYTTNRDQRCSNVYLTHDGFLVLPKIPGAVKLHMHRPIKDGGLLKSVTVTKEPNGEWYFSLLFEYPAKEESFTDTISSCFDNVENTKNLRCIGLDMSLSNLYVDSNGNLPSYVVNNVEVPFTKAYRRLERRIAREQHKLSKMKKDSANYKKQCIKIAKLHAKAKHRRSDFLHQIASRLAQSYDIIGIENLDMAAMKQSLKFGKSVSDNGWGTFVRILEEQCKKHGSLLIFVDKWFPSSKTCCHCGHIHKDLKLSERIYLCPVCGHVMDRDYQAAVNIREEALRIFLEYINQQAVA